MIARRLLAPAKLNLSLHVVGRRADGLHELVSEFALLDLADALLLMAGCSGLRVSGPTALGVPAGTGENLAWRGLATALGADLPLACLLLEKEIPASAGLGGGSSDAAAAWRLGRAWRGLGSAANAEVSATARLGADVPFFAAAVARAEVRGIGERVASLPPREGLVVLADPGIGLSTASVFAELRRSDWSDPASDPERNDLVAPARRLLPELSELERQFGAAGVTPRLTGSGPTLFAVLDDPERGGALAARLRRSGARVNETRLRTEAATIEEMSDELEEG